MTKVQRELLARLMNVCANLGNKLDGTATARIKYIERQQAHGKVWKVIYGIFGDDPDNENRKEDIRSAKQYLDELEELANKNYTDIHGN